MSDKYPSTLLVSLADKLAKITDEAVRRDIETEIRKADLDLLAKINEIAAGVQNVTQTFTVPGWGTFNFGKWYPYPAGQPVFTGFGTPTNVSFAWKREGGSLYISGDFTSGTPTGVEARISFPLSLVSDSTLVPRYVTRGFFSRSNVNATAGLVNVGPGLGYMVFSWMQAVAGVSSLDERLVAADILAVSQRMSVWMEVPVSGWN